MRQTFLVFLLVIFFIGLTSFVKTTPIQAADLPDSFVDRDNVYWGQLVKCIESPAVYYVANDGKRYSFPNEKTYFTYYYDYSFVEMISCDDLAEFQLGGSMTYQPGTRYLKLQSTPTVYAIEPGGVLRAIPDENWMETFVGEDWASMIDDLMEGNYARYNLGDPLDPMEIPVGMTALDSNTGITYYFVEDSQPKSLDGISFYYYQNEHFKNYTRSIDQAPGFYERVLPALQNADRIDSENEMNIGKPRIVDLEDWLYEGDGFPEVSVLQECENLSCLKVQIYDDCDASYAYFKESGSDDQKSFETSVYREITPGEVAGTCGYDEYVFNTEGEYTEAYAESMIETYGYTDEMTEEVRANGGLFVTTLIEGLEINCSSLDTDTLLDYMNDIGVSDTLDWAMLYDTGVCGETDIFARLGRALSAVLGLEEGESVSFGFSVDLSDPENSYTEVEAD